MEMPSARMPDDPLSGHDARPLIEDLRRVLRTELLRDTCSAATVGISFDGAKGIPTATSACCRRTQTSQSCFSAARSMCPYSSFLRAR